jgi:hypothetical protein
MNSRSLAMLADACAAIAVANGDADVGDALGDDWPLVDDDDDDVVLVVGTAIDMVEVAAEEEEEEAVDESVTVIAGV